MSTINLSKSFAKAVFQGFGGIDRKMTGKGGVSVVDLKNLRVGEGGTLTKRPGFAPLCDLPTGKLRAICAVSESTVFALIGGSLYEVDTVNGTCTQRASLTESDADACFFDYANALHLIDGNEIYAYDGTSFKAVEGYVPLYGKEWAPSGFGEHLEPMNALSSHLRLSFKIGDTSPSRLVFPHAVKSIDRVLLNGRTDTLANYNLHQTLPIYLELSSTYSKGDVIEVFYTPEAFVLGEARKKIAACGRAEVFGSGAFGGNPSTLALYGGDDPHRIFVSRDVSAEGFSAAKAVYPEIIPVYLTVSDAVSVNLSDRPICASCKSGGKLAVFTEDTAYLMTPPTKDSPACLTPISHTAGCSVKDGAITLQNAPVTLSKNGILHWTPSTLVDDEYTAECISLPISELMDMRSTEGCVAFYNSKNEIWLYRAIDERVWVYNTLKKCWYSFVGFAPERMLEIGGRMAFISDSALYVFDESRFYDEARGSFRPISAALKSDNISFGAPNRKKRLSRAMISFSSETELSLTVTDAESTPVETPIRITGAESIDYFETRLPCKRSRYYSFTLTQSDGPLSIYALVLSAVK